MCFLIRLLNLLALVWRNHPLLNINFMSYGNYHLLSHPISTPLLLPDLPSLFKALRVYDSASSFHQIPISLGLRNERNSGR